MKTIIKYLRLRRWLAAAGLALAVSGPPNGAAVTLTLLPSLRVTGAQVLLGDLVSEKAAVPDDWRDRAVLPAPSPGETHKIPIATIAYALQQYPDMDHVRLRGSLNTVVARIGNSLDLEQLKQLAEQYIREQEDWLDRELVIEYPTAPNVENLPAGNLRLEPLGLELAAAGDAPNRHLFHAAVFVDDVQTRTVAVPVDIIPLQDVWVAAENLPRGTTIQPEHIVARRLPLVNGLAAHITAAESILGNELSRAVRTGRPIFRHLLLEPRCAQSGDLITVHAASGTLSVSLQARALSRGRRGDVIQCVNLKSNRRLIVRLVDDKTAVLELPETPRHTRNFL